MSIPEAIALAAVWIVLGAICVTAIIVLPSNGFEESCVWIVIVSAIAGWFTTNEIVG